WGGFEHSIPPRPRTPNLPGGTRSTLGTRRRAKRSTKPSSRLWAWLPEFPGGGSGAPSTATARRRMSSPASWSTRLEQRERGKTRQAERGDTANGGASGYYRFS
ncbi:unnamed protein product, partial [Ectocarpus fasciculatus]